MSKEYIFQDWYGKESSSYKTILEALSENRVFNIKLEQGKFRIKEGCDNFYDLYLTPEQMKELGEEIIALSLQANKDF